MYILEDIECHVERVPKDVQTDHDVDHVAHSGKENLCTIHLIFLNKIKRQLLICFNFNIFLLFIVKMMFFLFNSMFKVRRFLFDSYQVI